ITVTSNDGTPGYNVSWAGPVPGDPAGIEITTSGGNYTISGASAGTYTITVTDANGCATTTISTITEPTSVTASATNSAVLCNGGSTGLVIGTASGGTAPYDMSWAGPNTGDPAGDEINVDGGSYTVNGAPAGSYVITMTDDNGCEGVTTTEIMEPEALSASAINTAVLCNGASNGTVEGTATGGIAPYNMSWTGPNTGNPAGDEINTDGGSYTVNGAPAGSYVITMTDNNGCSATATTTIIEPAILQINATSVPPLCNGVFNGSMDITAIGGTAPYDVSWSGPNSDDPVGPEIFNNGDSYTISGVGAGTYVVILTDAHLCTSTTTITLISPLVLTIATQVTNVACFNDNTGSIQVIANDGLPSYNVYWFGTTSGDPIGSEINSSGGNYVISNLSSGSYTVYVSDINGCIDSSVVQIIEPTELIQQQIITPTLCQSSTDGAVNFTVSGGTPSYNIELSGSVSSNPLGDEINLSGGSFTFSNLAAGSYTATITDNNNCIVTIPVIVSVGQNPLVITLLNDTICSGQSTTLSPSVLPSGGTFLWGNSSTDAAITVSPTTTTQYGVLYNYIGCYAQANALVVVNPIPTLSISGEIICEGESATLVPSGLQPTGGTFLWSTNSSEQTITVSPSVTSNYFVTYTVNGCSSIPANATITVNPIPSLVINNAAICSGQSATLTAVPTIFGGSIVWSPTNATTTSINVSPTVNTTYSAIYTLNNCSSESVSAEVTVNTIPQISFDASVLEGCSPLSIEFWNTSPDANLSTFTEWEIDNSTNFSGDTINPILDAGCHDITLSMTINGCTGSVTYNDFVCAESVPVASFISSTSSFSEISQSIDLINQSTGASNYIWNMGDGIFYETINVSHLFNQNTNGQTIWLTAISDLGCVDSTSLTILYEDPLIYYVPNSFTPDNDEYNNVFFPIITSGVDISSFEMTIFNRWGEVIFFTKNPYEGWDGSYGNLGLNAPSGVYTFIIKFKMPEKFDIQTIKGHINLLR
ncbi:MAG: gliding motility-associated C-terminal domain-containing protein, partial [Bacteroidota bacterium]